MLRNYFKFNINESNLLNDFDNKASQSIINHFKLTNYQLLVLSWLKGIWTGFLLALVLHYFIHH